MFSGLDIQLDFGMYEDDKETRKKARILKKKGGKPLGGKLFKMTAQNRKEQTKIKQEMKLKDDDITANDGAKDSLADQSGKQKDKTIDDDEKNDIA